MVIFHCCSGCRTAAGAEPAASMAPRTLGRKHALDFVFASLVIVVGIYSVSCCLVADSLER